MRLIQLTPEVIQALSAGDLAKANRISPVPLTPFLVGPECRGTWLRRSRQLAADPAAAPWITRAIFDPEQHVVVGRAGYHGPPDTDGMVEVGYAVDPLHRRRGYARAALVALLERAASEPAVRTVRATIRPDNEASLRLVEQYGFVAVGEQWDDEDGLEVIFEVNADAMH